MTFEEGDRRAADLWTPALGLLNVMVPLEDLWMSQIVEAYEALEKLGSQN